MENVSWRKVLTKVQVGVIVIGSAVLFQVAGALTQFGAEDMADWRGWLIGVGVGVVQAVGVAIIALKTSGGLSGEKPPAPSQ